MRPYIAPPGLERPWSWRSYLLTATIPGGGIPLPQGLESEDYGMEMVIRAKDSLGGTTMSNFMIVKVGFSTVSDILLMD